MMNGGRPGPRHADSRAPLKKCNPVGAILRSFYHEWIGQDGVGGSTHRLGAAFVRAIVMSVSESPGPVGPVPVRAAPVITWCS